MKRPPYRGSGYRAIGRSRVEGGLTPEQVNQFKQEFSGLEVGSSEYRRALQKLSRVARKGRVEKKLGIKG